MLLVSTHSSNFEPTSHHSLDHSRLAHVHLETRGSMTCLRAFGTAQPQCHPEVTAARLRRCSGAAAGPSGARASQHATAAGAQSRHRLSQQACRAQSAAPSECEPAQPSQQQRLSRQRLEALYASSDHFPLFASNPWRAGLPAAITPGTLGEQLLRPVGGLLHLAVKLEESPSPSQLKEQEEERRKRQDYYANVGDAIRTLREEIPLLFFRDLTCEACPSSHPCCHSRSARAVLPYCNTCVTLSELLAASYIYHSKPM